MFYLEPGPEPGPARAYWGPEIRVGVPQPALTTGMDALHQRRAAVVSLRSRRRRASRSSTSRIRRRKASIGIPIPDVTPLNPPLGLIPPLPPKIEHLSDTGHFEAGAGADEGLAYVGQHSDACSARGTLDVGTLRARAAVAAAGRRPGAGLPYDGLYYVKSVTHDIKRGSVQADRSRWRATGSSPRCRRCRYEPRTVSRHLPRQGREQHRPARHGAASWCRSPTSAARGPQLGAALPAGRPATGMGMFTVPPIGAGVWIAFVRGDADYPMWMGGYCGSGEAPSLSRNVPPGINGITLQTTLAARPRHQRRAGRRHPDPDERRRKDFGHRRGITISTGTGATLSLPAAIRST